VYLYKGLKTGGATSRRGPPQNEIDGTLKKRKEDCCERASFESSYTRKRGEPGILPSCPVSTGDSYRPEAKKAKRRGQGGTVLGGMPSRGSTMQNTEGAEEGTEEKRRNRSWGRTYAYVC